MPAFAYKALDGAGRNKSGVTEADNARQVRQQLREKGLIPLDVQSVAEKEKRQASASSLFARGISASDLALLTRQLATLIEAALPIEEALMAVAEQTEKPRHKSMMMAVRSKVVEGHTLADSLRDFPHVFDQLFCAMVAAGEKSGHLDTVLERLADYTENRNKVRSQIGQALIYPLMMISVAVIIVGILMTVVVPKIINQFDHMGQELPLVTRILIGISEGVQNYGIFVLILIVLLVVGFKRMMRQPALRQKWHAKKLHIPVLGKVIKGLNTARFASTLSILTASAVPLLEGMRISAEVLDNLHIQKAILDAADRVKEGTSLRVALEQTRIFPPMMMHMIASGERSGELQSMLARAAANQDRQFEAQVNVALSIFGPVLILSMAGIVFFIVAAILLPIIGLNTMV
ncbi:type II secretion system inner membrane protein GspF [Bowmanella sp. JS7-9]|uniref:General secretion pathway protein F n=1 Tax=Pseudobowmanella zhangzhouensis TaxID=1537679 RepID=A0ABW1XEG3_9ALTE|nr:type II secretion system inner membrane protein GspF [Bowmanella sp. JS7-9]TBX20894.1 general secretion pathway protein GspF [Bowmanella sp. JS7-9]